MCYLHDGKNDDEVTVIDIFPLELGGDNNGTGGSDTLDGVGVMVISISTIYTYIFTNIYISILQELLKYHFFQYKLYTILHINT